MKRRRPCPTNFTIGWIRPLALEYTAAKHVIDEEYDDSDSEYTTGRIHNYERNYAYLLKEDINADLQTGISKERCGHPFHVAVLSGNAKVARMLLRYDAALSDPSDELIGG
ncbi:hypothetical protein ASPCAL06632 [Aspergillus calidoustus]|uniref:Ankyrin repeat protein n=1 Tax=Aspergillus calidoustus TaxID=454130 RepID=A0A0U5C977_ASPCI|nr:hypothetical protein ASPCAL06632 [Aspergillus calidoustus]